jgi:hypothetical protein
MERPTAVGSCDALGFAAAAHPAVQVSMARAVRGRDAEPGAYMDVLAASRDVFTWTAGCAASAEPRERTTASAVSRASPSLHRP